MKAQFYQSVKPVRPEPTNKDILKAFGYILAAFFITVVILAGADLIDQLMIWFK